MLTVRFPDSEVWGSGFDVNEDSYGDDDDGDHSALVMMVIIMMIMMMMMMITMTMMMMASQKIPTSHIPTRWEYVIMTKGGNMTQSNMIKSNSHHV